MYEVHCGCGATLRGSGNANRHVRTIKHIRWYADQYGRESAVAAYGESRVRQAGR